MNSGEMELGMEELAQAGILVEFNDGDATRYRNTDTTKLTGFDLIDELGCVAVAIQYDHTDGQRWEDIEFIPLQNIRKVTLSSPVPPSEQDKEKAKQLLATEMERSADQVGPEVAALVSDTAL